MGVIWSAGMVERGTRVRFPGHVRAGTIMQASWATGDPLDTFILVDPATSVFRPALMNAAQMAMFLTEKGYEPWE